MHYLPKLPKEELIKLIEEMEEYQKVVFGKFHEFEEGVCPYFSSLEYNEFRRRISEPIYNLKLFEDSMAQIFELLKNMKNNIVKQNFETLD